MPKSVVIKTVIEIDGVAHPIRTSDCTDWVNNMIDDNFCDGTVDDIIDVITNDDESPL